MYAPTRPNTAEISLDTIGEHGVSSRGELPTELSVREQSAQRQPAPAVGRGTGALLVLAASLLTSSLAQASHDTNGAAGDLGNAALMPPTPDRGLMSCKDICQQNRRDLDQIQEIHSKINFGENPGFDIHGAETPQVYLRIMKHYGNSSAASFHELHGALSKQVNVGDVDYDGKRFKPASAKAIGEFLQESAPALSMIYQENYRSKGEGGCVALSAKATAQLQARGIDAHSVTMSRHEFVAVNVEGVLYLMDFTFNQFRENTVASPWGDPKNTGESCNLVLMPIGSSAEKQPIPRPHFDLDAPATIRSSKP
jgi:hypothetical protein